MWHACLVGGNWLCVQMHALLFKDCLQALYAESKHLHSVPEAMAYLNGILLPKVRGTRQLTGAYNSIYYCR
jgi:hypothetical protein